MQGASFLRLQESINPPVAVSNTLPNYIHCDRLKRIVCLLASGVDCAIECVLRGHDSLDMSPDELNWLHLRHEWRRPHNTMAKRLQQLIDLRLIDGCMQLELSL